jgi:hypothetical protein
VVWSHNGQTRPGTRVFYNSGSAGSNQKEGTAPVCCTGGQAR